MGPPPPPEGGGGDDGGAGGGGDEDESVDEQTKRLVCEELDTQTGCIFDPAVNVTLNPRCATPHPLVVPALEAWVASLAVNSLLFAASDPSAASAVAIADWSVARA